MSWQIILSISSFVAGVMSFPHCALMCGPLFVLFGSSWFVYHIGRILGYSIVGMLLGWIGLGLDMSGIFVSMQHFSILFIASVFIVSSMVYLLKINNRILSGYSKIVSNLINKLRQKIRPGYAVFFSGIVSALLPCGVLVPLWALCASSGSPFVATTMSASFVLGTIPGSLMFGFIRQQSWWKKLSVRHGFKMSSAILLLVVGVSILGFRGMYAPDFNSVWDNEQKTGVQCIRFSPIQD